MDFQPKTIIIVTGFVGAVLVANSRANFLPQEFFYLVAAMIASGYIMLKATAEETNPQSRDTISPQEAPEVINDFLRRSPQYKPFYLYTDDEEQSLHTRIKKRKEDGEKKVYFGMVGRPLNQDEGEVEYGEMIRVIWNLTDNDFVGYDDELPATVGVEPRLEPFENFNNQYEIVGSQNTGEEEMTEDPTGANQNVNIYTENNEGEQ